MNDWYDAEQRVERAQQLCEARRWADALAEIDAALEVNPENESWLSQRGFLLDQLERFEEAIAAYRKALEGDSQDCEVLVALAVDLMRVGRLSAALRTLSRLNEMFPDFEPGYCYRVAAYAELGRHDKAEEIFYLAQQLKPDCPHCFFHMGNSLADRGDHERAIYCWQRSLEIDADFGGVKGQMARAYQAMGDHERAKTYYLEAIRQDPGDVDLLLEMGELLLDAGDFDASITKFRQVIDLTPDHIDAHFALADALLQTNAPSGALELLEQVRELDPDFVGLDLPTGSAYLKLGRHTEALPFLEKAVDKRPKSKEPLMLLGNCLLCLQKPSHAADAFRRVIALDANVPESHHNLGICCFLMGDHEEGIEHCERAIALRPDYLLAVVKSALAYQWLGRFSQAREMIEYGLRVDPENAVLGQLRERLWRSRLRFLARRLRACVAWLAGGGRSS